MPPISYPLPPVRLREIECRSDRNDAGGVNLGVRHIVMALDVVEIDGVGDARLLIKVHQVALEICVIDDAPDVAFEVPVINHVKSDKRAEKAPVHFDDPVIEQVAAL